MSSGLAALAGNFGRERRPSDDGLNLLGQEHRAQLDEHQQESEPDFVRVAAESAGSFKPDEMILKHLEIVADDVLRLCRTFDDEMYQVEQQVDAREQYP